MKVSDYIAKFLEANKISTVFEMSGGMITHLIDSIAKISDITIVSMHHEQSASFAADAFGRAMKKPGIALATSGPGATNLLTGIGSCYFDSSPAIFITGQVNLHEQKGERAIRQLGFQETDIVSMALPITKKSYRITNAEQVPNVFQEAYKLAISGRPGPVLIDIPMNIQREILNIDNESIKSVEAETLSNILKPEDLELIRIAIERSEKPIIIAGGGINASDTVNLFLSFVEKTNIPVVTSLMALDVIPHSNPLKFGFWGSYGNRWANLAVGEADLMIVLGSRLDIRQTGADVNFFSDKKIIHIDCEKGEINNRLKNCLGYVSDLKLFFKTALTEWEERRFEGKIVWMQTIEKLRSKWPDVLEQKECKGINPNEFINDLSLKSDKALYWFADVGNHQMWTAQSLKLNLNQRFITSGGMGAMGFALPGAIGVCIASNKAHTVVIAGDGGIQLNIQELQTIVQYKLPIKIVVMNNQNLGMIRQFQDSYFDSRYLSTYWGYSAPNFEKIADAYGIDAKTINSPKDINSAINWLWDENQDSPKLLQVMIDPYTNAYPKIAFGKPLTEMEPYSKPIGMEST